MTVLISVHIGRDAARGGGVEVVLGQGLIGAFSGAWLQAAGCLSTTSVATANGLFSGRMEPADLPNCGWSR